MYSYVVLLSVVPDYVAGYRIPNFCPYVVIAKKAEIFYHYPLLKSLLWTRAV